MRILKPVLIFLLCCLLTILTQVGGVIYLVSLLAFKPINRLTEKIYLRFILKLFSFLLLYVLVCFLIVPPLAKLGGRVSLPFTATDGLQPLNSLTCLLNRNYVRPEMKQLALNVASRMEAQFPGARVNYLDANFPFFNGCPLFPHLSHNDGRKLDLAFCYTDREGNPTNSCPSFIGYGICEGPMDHEENTAAFCAAKGYWQYSILEKLVPQGNKKHYAFDAGRTKVLINLLCAETRTAKVFIEPHLKTRMGLNSSKIRFHGCQAVRHDDHIHVQL